MRSAGHIVPPLLARRRPEARRWRRVAQLRGRRLIPTAEQGEPGQARTEQYQGCRLGHGSVARQREGGIERGCAADHVGADSQPVRVELGVADPGLQIRYEGRAGGVDRPRGGEPEEVLVRVAQLHLGHEEVVIGRQVERRGERTSNRTSCPVFGTSPPVV